MRNLIFSIKPKYSTAIFNGEKTVEFRRTNARINPGDRIVIYGSAPASAIVGSATVLKTEWLSVENLWQCSEAPGLSKEAFLDYFKDRSRGCGIWFEEAKKLITPISLGELRRSTKIPSWMPPQSYRLLKPEESKILILMGLS